MNADDLIRLLDLKPHPEGGFFRETFRDRTDDCGRARSTAIYYLLRAGEFSRWHRIDAVEIWHFYAGQPLELKVVDGAEQRGWLLGPDLARGQVPQVIVAARCWQSARSRGAYSLVGCTVAPGFEFSGFELAPDGFTPV
jgi:predicted cupin superfamily sugar epimerase